MVRCAICSRALLGLALSVAPASMHAQPPGAPPPYRPQQNLTVKETATGQIGLPESEMRALLRHHERGDYAAALRYLDGLGRERGWDASLHYYTGFTYRQMERWVEAVEHYRKATVAAPRSPSPLLALGIVYQQQGDYARAIRAFTDAVDLDPMNANALNSLGLTYKMSGDARAAFETYQRAREARFEVAWNAAKAKHPDMLGTASTERGERVMTTSPRMLEYVRAELRSDLLYATIMNNIGVIYGEAGQVDEARSSYREAIEMTPDGVAYDAPRRNLAALRP